LKIHKDEEPVSANPSHASGDKPSRDRLISCFAGIGRTDPGMDGDTLGLRHDHSWVDIAEETDSSWAIGWLAGRCPGSSAKCGEERYWGVDPTVYPLCFVFRS
jgi:hypothetical protein